MFNFTSQLDWSSGPTPGGKILFLGVCEGVSEVD